MTPLPLDMTSTPAQVREARMLAQLTQEQAAELAHVDVHTIRRWETAHTIHSDKRDQFVADCKARIPSALKRQAS